MIVPAPEESWEVMEGVGTDFGFESASKASKASKSDSKSEFAFRAAVRSASKSASGSAKGARDGDVSEAVKFTVEVCRDQRGGYSGR